MKARSNGTADEAEGVDEADLRSVSPPPQAVSVSAASEPARTVMYVDLKERLPLGLLADGRYVASEGLPPGAGLDTVLMTAAGRSFNEGCLDCVLLDLVVGTDRHNGNICRFVDRDLLYGRERRECGPHSLGAGRAPGVLDLES